MTHPPEVDVGPAAPRREQHELFELPEAMRDLSKSATQADSSHCATRPDPPLTLRMVISMNAPNPPALATVSARGRQPTTALDLDTMARIAEEAGRDAVFGRADQLPLDAYLSLRAIPTTDGMLVTAKRLYQACFRAALDAATD